MSNSDTYPVWERTVALLGQISSSGDSLAQNRAWVPRKGSAPTRTGGRAVDCTRFTLVERVSDRAILVCWRDATLGHYAEQPWMKGVTRRSTRCVLSGLRVRRGGIVYRPSTRGRRCANFEEVVLAVVVDGATASIR
ncbi:DUF3331 domain-containing protein [Paraburkholderia sp. J8-2]|uniref:DUF3331 domain-containing protein n=1 Tax=Paraburkholderia sp. J8-2 TaxID=2805440 RepID=UPI002AB77959|nr:DUF3331 domain-containing protein [Paraburkholderia sp. J8-2]